METIIWFNQTHKDDGARTGGKGANLGELARTGAPVPPGFVVSAGTYADFIASKGLDWRIEDTLEDLDPENSQQLTNRAAAVRGHIKRANMPANIAQAIAEAYMLLGGGRVAVRSSATAEDLPDASFAGQQATYLNVEGADEVVKAVQDCWASLYTDRAIHYRATRGFKHSEVDIAVVIQRMIQSEAAGVAMSEHPNTGDPNIIMIQAGFGLGEAVVSGAVTPDTYYVDKTTWQIVEREIEQAERQQVMLAYDPDTRDNTWQSVPEHLLDAPKLNDEQIIALAKIVGGIEEHFGCSQDVEWAMEGGQLYITQARAVTKHNQDYLLDELPVPPDEIAAQLLNGQAASPGVATGRVVILNGPEECHLINEGDILVADMTTPDYEPAMKRAGAIVTNRGGRTCHAAIVAREIGVPCVVGSHSATHVLTEGQVITVDGCNGHVFDGVAKLRLEWNELRLKLLADKKDQMANTKTSTKVYAILADPEQAAAVAAENVDGVGLFRMEFLLNRIKTHPGWCIDNGQSEWFIQQLVEGFTAFCQAFGDRPVVLRLTDFKTNELKNLKGGIDYESEEENPMMGLRGARRYMERPDEFALELEAIRRVRQTYKNLYVMIPFVRTTDELRWTLNFMAEHGLQRGPDFKVWMMAEVPSNVLLIEEFIECGIDGASIGSNDLKQLLLGADRDSGNFQELTELDPAVMMAMQRVIRVSKMMGITVGICGQGPTDYPELARELVKWGITSISVSPDTIDHTREVVHQAEQEFAHS